MNDYKALGAVTHIGQTETVAGEGAGDRFTALGAKSVLCARQEQTNIGLEERCKGLTNTFKGTVKSEFVGLDTDPAGQEAQIAALLQANPDIDAILGTGPDRGQVGHRRLADRRSQDHHRWLRHLAGHHQRPSRAGTSRSRSTSSSTCRATCRSC